MPSPAVLADEGVKAVKAGKYNEGIEKLTEALKERPAPLWLLERSKAHLRTGNFDHALHDAERALRVAFDRANRDMMVESQIRRAVTYFRLKRYADADICAFWAIRLCEGARASEDDGQIGKVDASNGDYAVTLSEVTEANNADNKKNHNKQDGLAAAMGGAGGRTKETQWKNQAFSWRLQALTQLEKLPAGDAGRKVRVAEKYPNPPKELPTPKKIEEKPTSMDIDDDDDDEEDTTGNKAASKVTSAPGERDEASRKTAWEELWTQYRAVHAKNDIRSSFYQTDTTLNVDFFVKNVAKDDFKVDAQTDRVLLEPIPNTQTGKLGLYLYGKIKPDETKYTVKSMKIELALKKETPGKWPTLRKENSELVDNLALASFPAPSFNQFYSFVTSLGYQNPEDLQVNGDVSQDKEAYNILLEKLSSGLKATASTEDKAQAVSTKPASAASAKATAEPTSSDAKNIESSTITSTSAPKPTTGTANSSGPAYPTSSKKGPKNWDKIDIDDDDEDKEGKDGGGGGDVNSFFQQLYKSADDDTRRAMMKSYVESNGTSLSTSWAEAQEKTYETLPPDGSEVKKW